MNAERCPDPITLYQPCELIQGLLHENASCLAVRTYLKICRVPFTVKFRSNAEFMANHGRLSKLPLLKDGNEVFAEFQPIATHLNEVVGGSIPELEDELWAYVTWAENAFTMAEIYISFMDETVYEKVTAPRIKCAYPWPLNYLQAHEKRSHCIRLLKSYQWYDLRNEDVIERVEKCCAALTEKLSDNGTPYFGGNVPSELDAIVFGHIFTILTTKLSNESLAQALIKFPKLVEFCSFIEKKYFKAENPNDATQN